MPLDNCSIDANISSRIASLSASCPSIDLLVPELRSIDNRISAFVADVSSLPDINQNKIPNGTVVFVDSIKVHVVSNNGRWLGLDGRFLTGTSPSVGAWTWGRNDIGQLGTGNLIEQSSPVSVIGGFTDWCQISSGGRHTIGIRSGGQLWAWGYNACGQIGDNSIVARSSPVSVVGGVTDWCQVSAGRLHTAALRSNGTAWAWGIGLRGALGIGATTPRSSPVPVAGGFCDWCQISAGNYTTAAVRTNGTLWTWGRNEVGQLGDNTVVSKLSPISVVGGFTDWCQVSFGYCHTAAVRNNGTIWAWGINSNGQLGNNTTVNRSSPVSVIGGFTDWCQVSAGRYNTAAIRVGGTLWTWGLNSCGRLGDGTVVDKSSPVSVVGGFTDWCQVSINSLSASAVRSNGTIWSWGWNTCGVLGTGDTQDTSSPVSVIGGFTDWCQVSVQFTRIAALRSSI